MERQVIQNLLHHVDPKKMIDLEEDLEELANNRLNASKQKSDQSKRLQNSNLDVLNR
jgi:hypothetical protein